MPDLDGMGVLGRHARRAASTRPVIVQTAHGSIETVISAMRAGAVDFVVKPVGRRAPAGLASRTRCKPARSRDEIRRIKRRAIEHARLPGSRHPQPGDGARRSGSASAPRIQHPDPDRGRIGRRQGTARPRHPGRQRPPRQALRHGQLRRDPATTSSNRSCSAMRRAPSPARPRSMSASSSRPMAARSSSTRSANCRSTCRSSCCARSRRARSTRSAAAPGASVDFRLISATNQNLHRAGQAGRVPRGPLLPPQRLPDHAAAAARAARGHRRSGAPLHRPLRGRGGQAAPRPDPPKPLALLSSYDWPGNVRQLENAVFRAVVLADGDELDVAEFPQIAAQVERLRRAASRPPPAADRARPSACRTSPPRDRPDARCAIPMRWRSSTRTATCARSTRSRPRSSASRSRTIAGT